MMSAFPPQGGMPQHPGMHPGQPMPGGVPHPQTMGGPMQMHPGVAGPHGQQVSQAPMMGMQPGMGMPGGGPSAQAMQHLLPQGQMMHQPGMMQQGMNPQMMQQMNEQQRRMLYQRQMAMQRQAMGMQQQGQPGGFNPQQIAAMQASGQLGQLPPHMQQQMINAQMAAANAHNQQQNPMLDVARQQQQNLAAQQAHAQAQAQHLAMQQAHSQGSHQGQPTTQPGQPNQAPMRPASALAGTTGMEARPSPAPTAGPQGVPQPGPQVSQPPSQPNQQPQTSGPQGPQAQIAPSQPQPNQGQNPAQQAGNPQGQNQGQNRPQLPQNMNAAQLQAAQQEAMARRTQALQAAARASNGQALLQAFHFANKLGAMRADQGGNSIAYWSQFVQQHFTDDAIYRMILRYDTDQSSKTFEVHAAGLARYLYTQFESDMDQLQLLLDGSQEKKISETMTVVRAERSRMLHWFRDGTQVVWNGVFQLIYNGDKIEQLMFETRDHQLYYPRSKLAELCVPISPNQVQNRSPKMTKKQQAQGRNQQNMQPEEPAFDLRKLPKTSITPFGIHRQLQTQLELAETMNAMVPLISYSRDHPEMSVQHAIRSLVDTYNQNAQQMGGMPQQPGPVQGAFPPGGVQGPRNPAMAAAMGASPALSNSGLPGSQQANGATPSPMQNHMAPPMAPSMSQTSHASGSNTSPNVGAGGNKRRRSTAAGMKDDDGANGIGGGPKVKQSPRMASGNKRQKGS